MTFQTLEERGRKIRKGGLSLVAAGLAATIVTTLALKATEEELPTPINETTATVQEKKTYQERVEGIRKKNDDRKLWWVAVPSYMLLAAGAGMYVAGRHPRYQGGRR